MPSSKIKLWKIFQRAIRENSNPRKFLAIRYTQVMHIYGNNFWYGNRVSVWAVCVARLISTADSRTERLRLLLTGPNSHHCIARMYLIQLLLMSLKNKCHPRIVAIQKRAVKNIVAAASDQRNTVHLNLKGWRWHGPRPYIHYYWMCCLGMSTNTSNESCSLTFN